jgi:hypothetical protein
MEEGRTRFPAEESNGLGELTFVHPPRTFALTLASLIALQAIAQNQHLLSGSDLAVDAEPTFVCAQRHKPQRQTKSPPLMMS